MGARSDQCIDHDTLEANVRQVEVGRRNARPLLKHGVGPEVDQVPIENLRCLNGSRAVHLSAERAQDVSQDRSATEALKCSRSTVECCDSLECESAGRCAGSASVARSPTCCLLETARLQPRVSTSSPTTVRRTPAICPQPPCSRAVCSCLSQPIVIGDGCVLGERSALMGLSTMKKGSVLAPPMAQGAKGMQFEAGKTYVGNPADARAI
eukprot:scaffold15837_cov54-Phaeocystis_antarctica.AAC.2